MADRFGVARPLYSGEVITLAPRTVDSFPPELQSAVLDHGEQAYSHGYSDGESDAWASFAAEVEPAVVIAEPEPPVIFSGALERWWREGQPAETGGGGAIRRGCKGREAPRDD